MCNIQRFHWPVACMILLMLAGCAGTKVRTTQEIAASGLPKPERVLVYNFSYDPAVIKLNSSLIAKMQRSGDDQTADKMAVGREVADALATELTTDIAKLGLNPLRADENMPLTQGSILITGRFTNIDEGNRARRNVVGLGMGKSSVDCDVQVMAPGPSGYENLIGFNAHGDSGEMPGAAVMGPAGVAAGAGAAAVVGANVAMGGLKSYRSASAQQAKKIADKITDQLAKYFAQQGWISPDLAH